MGKSKKQSSITEDIKPSWLNPIRAAQAACKDNKGYAVLRLVVLVNKNDAIAWQDPKTTKIHPLRLSEVNITPTMLGMLLELSGGGVDNINSEP
jgi:hypothetical protein